MDDPRLKTFKEIAKLLQDSVTKEEFLALANRLAEVVKEIKTATDNELKKVNDTLLEALDTVSTRLANGEQELKDALTAKVDEILNPLVLEHESMMAECDAKMAGMKDGKDADEEVIVQKVLAQIPPVEIPEVEDETPESVRDLLETIEPEDEKLKISAIGHLEEELKKLRQQITDISSRPVIVGSSNRDTVKIYDISDMLDGVTKTFQTPAMFRLITVLMSSSPGAAPRETIDYTWTDTSITFTSQIDASTVLASGQSVKILYTSL